MNLLSKLGKPQFLWISLIATVVITIAFPIASRIWDLVLLDAISSPEQARAAIACMSENQKGIHAWMTGTLDVAYPMVYGALFIGAAFRFLPKRLGLLVIIVTLILILVDLTEGVVQIAALVNVADWLAAKALLTPTKITLFVGIILVTICGWIYWLIAVRPIEETNHLRKGKDVS